MIVVAWWLYCMVVALLLGLAAAAAEAALRASGRPARGVWAAALGGSLLLPFVLWLGPFGWFSPVADRLPALIDVGIVPLAPLMVVSGGSADGIEVGRSLAWGWALLSLAVGAFLLLSYARLRAYRSGWRRRELEGVPVWLSAGVGPAVVGLYRGSIVVPEWVLSLDRRLLRLVLLHEGEHLRAHDPRLVLGGLIALLLAPWNLPLWWQFRRLRLAVEVDCDARVLQAEADLRSYGRLLIEVARRRSVAEPLLAVALLEPTSHLERRIRMMTLSLSNRTRRVAGFGGLAASLLALAFCTDAPLGPRDPVAEVAGLVTAEPDASTASLAERPVFTPMDVEPRLLNADEIRRMLEQSYPPLLRDAGIAGTVVVWIYINENGRVQNMQVHSSSGHEALDDIAMRIAGAYRFSPALNRDQRVPVWVSLPISFEAR